MTEERKKRKKGVRVWRALVAIPFAASISAHLFIDRHAGGAQERVSATRSVARGPGANSGVSGFDLTLSKEAAGLYARHCAACHGWRGKGGPMAPPLSADMPAGRILSAIRDGVATAEGPFGPMPAVPDLAEDDAAKIARYLRALGAARAAL